MSAASAAPPNLFPREVEDDDDDLDEEDDDPRHASHMGAPHALHKQLVYLGSAALPATVDEAEAIFPHIPSTSRQHRRANAKKRGENINDSDGSNDESDTTTSASLGTQYFRAQRRGDLVHRLRYFPSFATETHLFSGQLRDIVQILETLGESRAALGNTCAKATLAMNRRLLLFGVQNRAILSNELRMSVWMARLRCIYVHMLCDIDDGEARLAACTVSASRDAEQRAAHGVILFSRNDANARKLTEWARKYGLMRVVFRDNVMEGLRKASLHCLWKTLVTLTHSWMYLPYSAYLVSYVHLLLERVAEFSANGVHYDALNSANYAVTRALYDFPHFVTQTKPNEKCAYTVLHVNDEFLLTTERLFYAVEISLLCCATHVQWLTPALSEVEKRTLDARMHAALSNNAMKRFEALVSSMLTRPHLDSADDRNKELSTVASSNATAEHAQPATSYVNYIEENFQDLFYSYVLLPGEWERFEMERAFDDRRAITCVSRMRPNDFDRYQEEYVNKPIEDVWAALVKGGQRTHPAYAVIAERAMHYYFSQHFASEMLSSYLVDVNTESPQLPKEICAPNDAANDPLPPCTAFRAPGKPAETSRGTARHILCGTRNAYYTADAVHSHPLMVRTLGSYAVVDTHGAVVAPRRTSNEQNFAAGFLHWLHAMAADKRVRGVLHNGQSIAPLLRELRPHEQDSVALAAKCEARAKALREERLSGTNLLSDTSSAALVLKSNEKEIFF